MTNCGLRPFLLPGSAISNILCPIFSLILEHVWTIPALPFYFYDCPCDRLISNPVHDGHTSDNINSVSSASSLHLHFVSCLHQSGTGLTSLVCRKKKIMNQLIFFKQDIADLNHSHVILTHASTVQTGPLNGPFLDWHDWKLWHQSIQL